MKLEKDHAVIQTAEEAAPLGVQWNTGVCGTVTCGFHADREQILKAITPAEGDAVFWWDKSKDSNAPNYLLILSNHWMWTDSSGCTKIKANSLTIGKTVGKLRELLTWAKGE